MTQYLLVLIIIIFVVNQYTKEYSLDKIKYTRQVQPSIVEVDEVFNIKHIVENHKWLPVSFFQVKDAYPLHLKFQNKTNVQEALFNQTHTMTMMLMPFQRVARTYTVSAQQRGRIVLRDAAFVAGDFIGLDTVTETYRHEYQEIVVLPKSIDLNEALQPYGDYYGEISVKRWIIEDPLLNIGLREYSGNEPLKKIHWPSSLKSNQLMVKNDDYTVNQSALVVLNTEVNQHPWQKKDYGKIELCFSLARVVLEQLEGIGVPYGMASNVTAIHQFLGKNTSSLSSGRAHLSHLLEALGRGDYFTRKPFFEMINTLTETASKTQTFVLITPYLVDQDLNAIERLANKAGKLIILSLWNQLFHELDSSIERFAMDIEKDR